MFNRKWLDKYIILYHVVIVATSEMFQDQSEISMKYRQYK